MSYEQALEYLSSLNQFGMNFGLERINRLVELMHHPERRFKSIHITGSNGKGSTAAMLHSILSAAGLRTGLYISPHLTDYTERIVVNGNQISREEMANAIFYTDKFVREMLKEGFEHPTEFEILTAAAFYYFAVRGVEYVVVEAGLGGLLDSTNVVLPKIAVITNVVLEHTDRCGDTIGEIAWHKAGIIKDNVAVVTAAQGEALEIIRRRSREKNSQILVYQEDFSGAFQGATDKIDVRQKMSVETKSMGKVSFELNLLGSHQLENCSLAVAAALKLSQDEKRITHEAIRQGLKGVRWPGRFEVVNERPVIIIDGAHNPDGAKVLRENLDRYFPGKKITFVIGMLRDKDRNGIITNLVRPLDTVVTIQSTYYRAAPAEDIAQEISGAANLVEAASSVENGVARAKELAGAEGVVCVAGSLYHLGDVRAVVYKKPDAK